MSRLVPLLLLAACGPGVPVPDAPAIVSLQEDTPDPVVISVVVDDERELERYEVEVDAPPEHGELDILSGTAPLEATYHPAADWFGTDMVGYTIRPKKGKAEATGVVVIVVEPEPDPPTATADAVTGNEREPLSIDVVANDVDPDGDLLIVTSVGTPTAGTASIASAGVVLYTPVVGALGDQTFTYTIQDPTGRSDTATVTVTVAAAPAVAITSFTATPAHPDPGGTVELAWTTVAATDCTLDPGAAAVPTSGSTTRTPTGATTYVLTCEGAGGPALAAVSVLPWAEDEDHDGINDLLELDLGLDPVDPDTDADGVFDGSEVATDPLDPDSDDDGWSDGEEDLDRDGAVAGAELDPADPDSDDDGVCDGPRVDGDGDGIGPADGCTDPDVWFVKAGASGNGTSWGFAFGTLAEAFAAASDGDHVWIAEGTYPTAPLTLTKSLHVVGGFAGDEGAPAARHGGVTLLNEPAPGAGTTRMFTAIGVSLTFAGVSTTAYDAGWLLADTCDLRAWDLDVTDEPSPGAVTFLLSSGSAVIARGTFHGIAGGSSVWSTDSDLVIADSRFEHAGGVNPDGGSFTAFRSRWSGDGQVSVFGADAVFVEVQFTEQSLLVDEASDATIVDGVFDGPGDGLIVQGDAVAFATGASFRNKTNGVVGCDDEVHLVNTVFYASTTADTACTGALTVAGSASDRALPSGNTLLTQDPFQRFASGEQVLDPDGQAVGKGSDASADDGARGYPSVGLDWRMRFATGDLALDAEPVDAGAHFDPSAARIVGLTANSEAVTWTVRNARTCRLTGPEVDLVLDAPTTGSMFAGLSGGDEVTLWCEGPNGTLPALARALVE